MTRPLCPRCESANVRAYADPIYGRHWTARCYDCTDGAPESTAGVVGYGSTEAEALDDWAEQALLESACAGCGACDPEHAIVLTDVRGWCWCQPCLDSGREHPWDAESWCAEHGKQKGFLEPCPQCVAAAGGGGMNAPINTQTVAGVETAPPSVAHARPVASHDTLGDLAALTLAGDLRDVRIATSAHKDRTRRNWLVSGETRRRTVRVSAPSLEQAMGRLVEMAEADAVHGRLVSDREPMLSSEYDTREAR